MLTTSRLTLQSSGLYVIFTKIYNKLPDIFKKNYYKKVIKINNTYLINSQSLNTYISKSSKEFLLFTITKYCC